MDQVGVCNLALSAMGTATIESLDEDSAEARACSLWYEPTLNKVLRSRPWNFARSVVVLDVNKALPGTDENNDSVSSYIWNDSYPVPPWDYEYDLPSDIARVRYVVPASGIPSSFDDYKYMKDLPVLFEVTTNSENRTVLATNQQNAVLVYTRKIEDPDLWDPDFLQAVISELAMRLTIPLSGDREAAKLNFQISEKDKNEAAVNDANEGLRLQEHPVPNWISARDA